MADIDDIFAARKLKTGSLLSSSDDLVQKKVASKLAKDSSKGIAKKTKSKTKKSKSNSIQPPIVEDEAIAVDVIEFKNPEVAKQRMPDDELFKPQRKMTEDGLPVYKEDELNIGLGKDTEDCPFDCDCCY